MVLKLVPRELMVGSAARKRTEWASTLPKQRLTDALRRIQAEGAQAVAAGFPPDLVRLSDDELTHWDGLEARALDA